MNYIFLTGIVGSIILVMGAACPEPKTKKHPVKSFKNWLFAGGALIMLAYAILNYFIGGSVFFIFLEVLIVLASVLMMLDIPDNLDAPIIALCGLGLVAWSLFLFEDYKTIFFITGLSGVGLGYIFDGGTLRRSVALTLGSILIAIFSYIEVNWIFFWLNAFFAGFSGYYVLMHFKKTSK